MNLSAISAHQILQMLLDEATARVYLEHRRFANGVVYPCYSELKRITPRMDGFYRYNAYKKDFTVRTGMFFERSFIQLHKWIYAFYQVIAARESIGCLLLRGKIGAVQKSAWFIFQRICETRGNEKSRHFDESWRSGCGVAGKIPAFGPQECGASGRIRARLIFRTDALDFDREIHGTLEAGSTSYTDEHRRYGGLDRWIYIHGQIKHRAGEYVRGFVPSNGFGSVLAVVKRSLHGVLYHASKNHIHRCVDECTFRSNDGDVKQHLAFALPRRS